MREARLPTRVMASTERAPALEGADYVIASIRVGERFEPEALDVQIPLEIGGLRQTVSDTVGVGDHEGAAHDPRDARHRP